MPKIAVSGKQKIAVRKGAFPYRLPLSVPYRSQKIVIGLTGGIATGKSAVLREFRNLGAQTVDCDALARDAVRKGQPALKKIAGFFGLSALKKNGSLDRAKLGEIIFQSPVKRRRLEKIVHPQVKKKVLRAIGRVRKGVIVVDVPLLFEAGWRSLFDETVLVFSRKESQIKRLERRDGLTKNQALTRIGSQWPLQKKRKIADHVIDNSHGLRDTIGQIRRLWREWSKRKAFVNIL